MTSQYANPTNTTAQKTIAFKNKLKQTQNFNYQKKNQGIIMHAINEINIKEYLIEFTNFMNPQIEI